MSGKRIYGKIFSIVCLFLILLVCAGNVRAQEGTEKTEEEILEEIKTHGNSIVRVESICWDGDHMIYGVKSFSGFVVSGNSTGIYVATVHNNLTFSTKEKEAIQTANELEENARLSEKIEVIFSGDLRVGAEIVGESEQRDLTVLQLRQNINFGEGLRFSKEDVATGDSVYLLSFPGAESGNKAVYNVENVEVKTGTVQSLYRKDDVVFFRHNIRTDMDSVGGLLLNKDGCVVGMLLVPSADKEGSAIGSKALKAFLGTLNVNYLEYEETAEEKKIPVLNIVLGAVILVLLILVICRQIRGVSSAEKGADGSSAARGKRRGKNTKGKNTREKNMAGRGIRASLEYPREKRTAMIHKGIFVIGRNKEADFILEESRGISRRHACIRFDGRNFYLSDMNSTNHTFLNGREVMPGENALLSNGDEITVGQEKLIFHIG